MSNKKNLNIGRMVIKKIICVFLIYLFVFGVAIYYISPQAQSEAMENFDIDSLYGEGINSSERAVLVEERKESYLARLDMIESANESIDIACYMFQDGITTRSILGALTEAADRGVKVRILADGMFNQNRGEMKKLSLMCKNDSNMQFRFYQMTNLLKLWTLNNRLHDKFMIIDGKTFMLGGRNLGNRYFTEDFPEKEQVRDRDVIILGNGEGRAVNDLADYFQQLWESDASRNPSGRLTEKRKDSCKQLHDTLIEEYRKERISSEKKDMEFYREKSVPVKKVTVINNPVGQYNKYPVILRTLGRLASESDRTEVQSPYTVPCYKMNGFIDEYDIDWNRVTLYTNSLYSSPNPMGISGYLLSKKDFVKKGIVVWEYQSPGSIHGKSAVFDRRLSAVGSFNLECRSAFLSTETMVFIDSPEFAEELLDAFDDIESKSYKVDKDGGYIDGEDAQSPSFAKRSGIRILSILSAPFRILI